MGFRVMHNHNSSHKYVKIHTAGCKHFKQMGIDDPANVTWYGIYPTLEEANQRANSLGENNVTYCGKCHPERQ